MDEKLKALTVKEFQECMAWQIRASESTGGGAGCRTYQDAEQKQLLAVEKRIAVLEQQLADRNAKLASFGTACDAAHITAQDVGSVLQNLLGLCDTAGTQSAQIIPRAMRGRGLVSEKAVRAAAIYRSPDQDIFDDEWNTKGQSGLARLLGSTN